MTEIFISLAFIEFTESPLQSNKDFKFENLCYKMNYFFIKIKYIINVSLYCIVSIFGLKVQKSYLCRKLRQKLNDEIQLTGGKGIIFLGENLVNKISNKFFCVCNVIFV